MSNTAKTDTPKTEKRRTWLCDDGNAEVAIDAYRREDAAQEYVDDGDWGDSARTFWVTVYTYPGEPDGEDDRESHTIAVHPDEPDCESDQGHDWQSPYHLVGGIKENPGVWGHGGGVRIKEVCMRCGCGRHTNTWAQNPATGEQGLDSVEYVVSEYDLAEDEEDEAS